MSEARRELLLTILVVMLCTVATGAMLFVPPSVLEAGLIYGGF